MTLTDQSLMPFGKHKDKKMANVPAEYLLYIFENFDNLHDNMIEYIKENYEGLTEEALQASTKYGNG